MKQGHFREKRALVPLVRNCLFMGLMILVNVGCSAVMAAKQPDKKDLSILKAGTPRSHVIAELGAPGWSGEKDGRRVDVFAFKQGYSKGTKAGRAFFHAAADFFTLGLWEVVGTPIESVASGTDVKVEVVYDENDRVKVVQVLGQEKTNASVEAEEMSSQGKGPTTTLSK